MYIFVTLTEPCDIARCPMCWRCYDCTNPECQCTLPEGMKNCKNLPAKMAIDYIRLYQDPHDVSHTIGCSPPDFPTAGFIQANIGTYVCVRSYTYCMYEFVTCYKHLYHALYSSYTYIPNLTL